MTLQVHIITPEKGLPVLPADHVTIPGSEGEMGIRTGHAPLITLLRNGRLFIKSVTLPNSVYAIRGGVAQVYKDEVRIFTEAMADPTQISEAQIVARLQTIIDGTYNDPIDQIKAKAEAGWLITILTVAGKQVPNASRLGL
jgi:F-type H+-transporting ATPase subunit epsilon